MPLSLNEFRARLIASGLVSSAEVDAWGDAIPQPQEPSDSQKFAKELVRQKKLTKFQAAVLYQGHAQPLVLGKYVILDKIGAGGMGQVFRARHRVMDRLVAIKVLPPKLVSSPDAIKRFHREVKAAAQLEHANIVTAYDADQEGKTHFLVMQLVDGQDLSEFVKANGAMPLSQAVDCVVQAAAGLAYAHERGVVHRDIKPANLLLGNDGNVKILDMGLARLQATGDDEASQSLTQSGQIMGTVHYMSPEQALDTHTADARSDIYSLGCTLHFLLTGQPVYRGSTTMATLLAHRDSPIPVLSDSRAEVSPTLNETFHKMVAKEAKDRFQSMDEVVVALKHCSEAGGASPVDDASMSESKDSNLTDFLGKLGHQELPTKTNTEQELPPPATAPGESQHATALAASVSEAPPQETAHWQAQGETMTIPPQAEPSEAIAAPPATRPAPARSAVTSTSTSASPVPANRRAKRLPPAFLFGGIAGAVLLTLLIVAFAAVITLRTPQGTLQIDVADQQDVSIEVLQGGKLVEVADKANNWTIRLAEGKYDVALRGGNDKIALSKDEVAVTRGKEIIVRLTHTPVHPDDDTLQAIDATKDAGLVGRWVFQAPYTKGRTVRDLAGNLDVTLAQPARLQRVGSHQAIVLDRTGPPILMSKGPLPANLPTQTLTATAWVRVDEEVQRKNPKQINTWDGIIGAFQDNFKYERGWVLGMKNGQFMIGLNSKDTSYQHAPHHPRFTYLRSQETFTPRKWSHVAGTYDGKTLRLYVNGKLSSSSEQQQGDINYPSEAFYEIGAYHDQNQNFRLAGGIHEIRVYDRALSAEEISQQYQQKASHFPQTSAPPETSPPPGNPSHSTPPAAISESWRLGKPVHLGGNVNTDKDDKGPGISADGLALVFHSNRQGIKNAEIYMATRSTVADEFGPAKKLGANVNSAKWESSPQLSDDGLRLYFNSNRRNKHDLYVCTRSSSSESFGTAELLFDVTQDCRSPALSADECVLVFSSNSDDGSGNCELWMARRPSRDEPFGKPVCLGGNVNSTESENSPYLLPDGLTLLFSRSKRVFISRRTSRDAPFALAEQVDLQHSEQVPLRCDSVSLSADGRTLYFDALDRPGGHGKYDLWSVPILSREEVTKPAPIPAPPAAVSESWQFGEPVNLGEGINSNSYDNAQTLSGDDLTLVFASSRPDGYGKWDLWMATRKSKEDVFGEAVNLGDSVNSDGLERNPNLSQDGLRLYYQVSEIGQVKNGTLMVSERAAADQPFGKPVSLGIAALQPSLSQDECTLVFNRGSGNRDLWMAQRLARDKPFGKPVRLSLQINSSMSEESPCLLPDGLSLLFSRRQSGRAVGLYLSRRVDRNSLFGPPTEIYSSETSNVLKNFTGGSPSADGRTLYFSSNRSGGHGSWDLWSAPILSRGDTATTTGPAD